MENNTVFYYSNWVDIFYHTKQKVWKEKLLIYQEKQVLLEEEKQILEYLKTLDYQQMGVDFSKMTHKEFLQVQKWAGSKVIIDENPIAKRREIKRGEEINKIRRSAKLNQKGMEYIYSILKEGVTEKEVAWAFEKFVREEGAEGLAFSPIVAFKEHTAFPHHKPTDRKLQEKDEVTLDVGLMLDDYASDCTRSFTFKRGQKEDNRLEELILEAHQQALDMCEPGVDFMAIQEKVDQFFQDNGVLELKKHSLGHGVGLEVHERPFVWSKNKILQEGMVITIEPGLYQTGSRGYRHEDTIIITKNGYENLYD